MRSGVRVRGIWPGSESKRNMAWSESKRNVAWE